jgi:hypothetical protein
VLFYVGTYFQVGRSELRLISPDRKQILLHREFKDVASCVLGRINKEHFGFVCRETNESYACYVFKCESDSIACEVVNGEFLNSRPSTSLQRLIRARSRQSSR